MQEMAGFGHFLGCQKPSQVWRQIFFKNLQKWLNSPKKDIKFLSFDVIILPNLTPKLLPNSEKNIIRVALKIIRKQNISPVGFLFCHDRWKPLIGKLFGKQSLKNRPEFMAWMRKWMVQNMTNNVITILTVNHRYIMPFYLKSQLGIYFPFRTRAPKRTSLIRGCLSINFNDLVYPYFDMTYSFKFLRQTFDFSQKADGRW